MMLLTVGLWISIPGELKLNLAASGATLVLLVCWVLAHRHRFEHFYTSSFFLRLCSHSVSAFLVLCLLALLNFWAFVSPHIWEMDSSGRARLTAQTREVLARLQHPVHFRIFAREGQFPRILPLLELYRLESSKLNFDLIDAESRPEMVEQYAVTEIPQIVLESGGRTKKVRELSELAITNALIKLSRPKDPVIFYSTGHAEMNLEDTSLQGGGQLAKLARAAGFEWQTLNLRQVSSVPASADLVVLWGPKSHFEKRELEALNAYLEGGGSLLVALDPQFKDDPLESLRDFLRGWGLAVANNLVIDKNRHAQGSEGNIPIPAEYSAEHPVTKGLAKFKDAIFFPLSSSVLPALSSKRAKDVSVLAFSSPHPASWGEARLSSLQKEKFSFQEGEDLQGPLGYVGAYQSPEGSARVVAFGNSRFVANAYRKYPKNFNLFLNSLYWMADQDHLAAFDVPAIEESPLFVNRHQMGLVFYTVMLILPLALLMLAFVFYQRRRAL